MAKKQMYKICISLHSLEAGGGVQERRVMIANKWCQQGHDVTIVVPVEPLNRVSNIDNRIRLVFLGKWQRKTSHHLMIIPKMIRFFKRETFNYVFVATPQHIFITTQSIRIARSESKVIASVHGTLSPIGGLKEKITKHASRFYLKRSIKRVDKLFGVSFGVSSDVQGVLNTEKIKTIHNPVIDNDKMIYNEKYKKELRSLMFPESWNKVIVSVGRLNNQKGYDYLIKSMLKIQENTHLVILGEGEKRRDLELLIRKNNLEERVHLLGYKSNPIEYMAAADCFALASRYEGFGNVIVEALYAQTPIVSFDCQHGPSDIINDERLGALVTCFDLDAFALEINKKINSSFMNENDRWKEFSVSIVAEKYLQYAQS